MPDYNYVFGLIRTGEILAEIPLESVNITGAISDTGNFTATFHTDQVGYDNATLKEATVPGLCFVVPERDGKPLGGYIVWSRTYQSQGKSVQLFCQSYEGYPSYRFMPDFSVTNVDQMDVFIQLWNLLQGETGSNLNVVVPASLPKQQTVLQTLLVKGSDYRTYRDVMDDMAGGDTGFDWTIDWARSGSIYTPTLRAAQPKLGAVISPDVITFEYPGNILNYYDTDSAGDAGTNVYTMGAGSGDSVLVAVDSRPDLIDEGFLRLDLQVQSKTTTNQNTLNLLGDQQMKLHALPVQTIKCDIKADLEPVFGSYGLGDSCHLTIKDGWNSTAIDKDTRIIAWSFQPSESDAVEEVSLVFEGDDVSGG